MGELLPLKGKRIVDPISKAGKDIGRCPQHQHESSLPVSWIYTDSKEVWVYLNGHWQNRSPSSFIKPDQHEFIIQAKRDNKGNTIQPIVDSNKCYFCGQRPNKHLAFT